MEGEGSLSGSAERPAVSAVPKASADWRILSQVSVKGSSPFNEDMTGSAGSHAWIIDGSAFFSGAARTEQQSEGAWLAQRVDEILRSNVRDEAPLSEIAATLEATVTRDYAALGDGQPERVGGEGPSAVLGLLRLSPTGQSRRIEGVVIGDVSIIIRDGQRMARWTDPSAGPFEARTIAAAGTGLRREGEPISAPALAQIHENRRFLNRPDGYWAVHPGLPWRGGLRSFVTTVSPTATVLLASDGFMRLVDVLKRYDEAGLMQAVVSDGAAALVDELRRLESGDPRTERFNRVKIHDDATALVVTPDLPAAEFIQQ